MSSDVRKKVRYMLNMESGANFEYLAGTSERNGDKATAFSHLRMAESKYRVAHDNAVTEEEKLHSDKAVKRTMDRIASFQQPIK